MQHAMVNSSLTPAKQAGIILSAWVRSDHETFHRELQQALQIPTSPRTSQLEQERAELLCAVSTRLRTCPDPLTDDFTDPVLRLCINLLSHVANQPVEAEIPWSLESQLSI